MSWWVFLDIILFDKIILHLFCELQGSNPPKPLALRKLLQVAFKHKCPSPTMNHIFYIVHTVQLQTIRNRLSWICHLSAYTPSQHVHTLSLSLSSQHQQGIRKEEDRDEWWTDVRVGAFRCQFFAVSKRTRWQTFGWRGFQAIMTDSPVCPSVYTLYVSMRVTVFFNWTNWSFQDGRSVF